MNITNLFMETIKKMTDPVVLAKRNMYGIAIIQILAVVLMWNQRSLGVLVPVLLMAIIFAFAAHLLSKRNIHGVYLSWFLIAVAAVLTVVNGAYLGLLIWIVVGQYNHKAQKALEQSKI